MYIHFIFGIQTISGITIRYVKLCRMIACLIGSWLDKLKLLVCKRLYDVFLLLPIA